MLIGLVGKPNVGKSTFFKALTLAEVAIAPYPFTTIEKNEGVGFVKVRCVESEFKVKCKPRYGYCISSERFIPVKLVDVAGLVPGAHLGKGRGNQFLNDLCEADVLIHILDASGKTDEQGQPTENHDVTKDVKFLQEEIDFWLHSIIGKDWQHFIRKSHNEKMSKRLGEKLSGLKITEDMIKKAMNELNLSEKASEWNNLHLTEFVRKIRKLSKPIIIAANKADKPEARENINKLKQEFPDLIIVPCSAEAELALKEAARERFIDYVPGSKEFEILQSEKLNEQQRKALEFIKNNVLDEYGNTGVQECLNKAILEFLHYIVVYPVENEHHYCDKDNNILPDAFLMPPESTALDLAYAIHTDIGKNFISAIDARTHKRLARDYKLKSGDVIRILTK
jgi:hypothetical protein